MDRAACVGHDPEIWTSDRLLRAEQAVAICRGCQVLEECDAYVRAIDPGDRWWIWAGVSWRGPESRGRPLGTCKRGHRLGVPGNPWPVGDRACRQCNLLRTRAAAALGVVREEYVRAFGGRLQTAVEVLQGLGVDVSEHWSD
jgi:hypothetical protein